MRYAFANLNAEFLCASDVMMLRDAAGLIREFAAARALRPDIKKPVWHQALRLPVDERIAPERCAAVVQDYMARMGFDPALHQWMAILSNEDGKQHAHIVASRVDLDGRVWLGQNENLISTRITQELERDHGLKLTKGPGLVPGTGKVAAPKERKPKKNEVEMYARLERESVGRVRPMPRRQLQRALKQAVEAGASGGGLQAFLATAERAGVRVRANLAETGKVNGLSFETSVGVPFKGSDLGAGLSWAALSKTVGYDADRDLALLIARSVPS